MLLPEQEASIHSTTVAINAAIKKRFTFKHYFNLGEPIKTAESLRYEVPRWVSSSDSQIETCDAETCKVAQCYSASNLH